MIGNKIYGFEIIQKLGEGGTGSVYKGYNEFTDSFCAIKFIKEKFSFKKEIIVNFLEETKIILALSHPCIVKIINFGMIEERPFIIMEYINGLTLDNWMKKSKISSQTEIIDLILKIADIIKFVHNNNPPVIHCDLKPSNIFITNDNNIKITDFGSAYFLFNSLEFNTVRTEITESLSSEKQDINGYFMRNVLNYRTVSGTYFYTDPQIFLSGDFGFYNDIYSIGVLLYRLLTDIIPVGYFELPSKINKSLNIFDKIIIKCLHNDINKRYSDIDELMEDLRKIKHSYFSVGSTLLHNFTGINYIPTTMFLDLYENLLLLKPRQDQYNVEEYIIPEEKKIFIEQTQIYNSRKLNHYLSKLEYFLKLGKFTSDDENNAYHYIEIILSIDPKNFFAKKIKEDLLYFFRKNFISALNKVKDYKNNIELIKKLTDKMAYIPQSAAVIGYNDGLSREQPEYTVFIEGFYIDKYVITVGNYKKFKQNYKIQKEFDIDEFPLININYYDFEEYAEFCGKEIPNELQWEKAGRGKHNYLYSYGNKYNKNLAYTEKSIADGLIKKGQFAANDYGLYDMTGLVWEWTNSKYYPHPGNLDFKEAYLKNYKILKGGCLISGKDHCRNSFRFYYKPELKSIFIGGRLSLSQKKLENFIVK